ncbi:MAG TPA: hypothetical protein VFM82_02850 [Flavobacteriaceae bacterium]|nr:hypothetical protein [Flavobacteriaceae bacterium]
MKKQQTSQSKETGFKIPPGYFEEFDARLSEKLQNKHLPERKLQSGFEVPKNYFNDFRVEIPAKKEGKVISLFSKRNLKYAMAIAAIFVLMFSILPDDAQQENDFSTIEQASLGTYLENNIAEFPLLENILMENNQLNEPEFKNLDKELLFNYLTEHSTEISLANY